jgi:uncharacterized membrane protein
VRTAQVRAEIELAALDVLTLLGGSTLRIPLFLELAPASARLESIACARADDPVHAVTVGVEPGIARVGVGRYPDLTTSPLPVAAAIVSYTLPLLGSVQVLASGDVTLEGEGESLLFEGPFPPDVPADSPHLVQSVGAPLGESVSGALGDLAASLDLSVSGPLPIGVPAGALLSQVALVADPVLSAADLALEPLLRALGVTLGGADVSVFGVVNTAPTLVR